MTTYPRDNGNGRTVWACCTSTIGPVCQHWAGERLTVSVLRQTYRPQDVVDGDVAYTSETTDTETVDTVEELADVLATALGSFDTDGSDTPRTLYARDTPTVDYGTGEVEAVAVDVSELPPAALAAALYSLASKGA